jgi:NADPH-dependent 2,4-dienoyl-CoA reductase/sulfur reductase-like enzyme
LNQSDFVIIGGGPGGISAAIKAAQAGVNVTLLDENERLGGQVFRQLEKGFEVTDPDALGPDFKEGKELLHQFNSMQDKIRYLNNTLVWGIFNDSSLALARYGTSSSLRFKHLLVATGAYDRPVPFPGWTLPGVFTAGGAQKLVKSERVLPGQNILLAGTGPLQLVLADQILKAGGKIEGILEAGNFTKNWLQGLKGIWGNWDFLVEGVRYLRSILKAGVPLLQSHILLEARGDGQVEEAVIAKVDKNWRPRLSSARSVKVDSICLGYGLVSSTELTMLAECEHQYDLRQGGYIPLRKANMETSVPGIFAVGDGAGVAGKKVAIEEGCIAGIAVASALGYISPAKASQQIRSCHKRLSKINRFRKVLDDISLPRPGLYELATDDTVICRCEDVTLKQLKAALADDTIQIKDFKRLTRMGMGPCEGRMCGPSAIEMMRHQLNASAEDVGCLKPRPSIKPVALGVLAANNTMPVVSGRYGGPSTENK